MPSLKSLLNSFGKATARNAFPSASSLAIEYTSSLSFDNSAQLFIAPDDGFFYVFTKGGSHIDCEILRELGCGMLSSNASGTWGRACLAVSKGESVWLGVYGNNHDMENTKAYFFPARASV